MKPGSIYMDNCVTTKPAKEVLEAMQKHLEEQYWYPGSFISTGESINDALEAYKTIIASTLGASSKEIYFSSGGTLANNIAIKGLVTANAARGSHIICSVVDYPDLLTNAAFFEQSGFEVTYLNANEEGYIDLEQLRKAIRPDTILFMTTLVNHVVGTIQPLKEISKILMGADHKIMFHVDACQAYGKMRLIPAEHGIDSMAISAHKIHGPQGIGALYLKQGTKVGQLIHGVARINGLQTGGMNIALIAGFAKAAELNFRDLDSRIAQLKELSSYLYDRLVNTIPDIELNGPPMAERVAHNVNVSLDFIEGEAVTMMLDMHGITVATGSACASQGLKANYVLMAIGKNHVQSHGSMKFTLSIFNTKDQIDFVVQKLAEIAIELRKRSPLYLAKQQAQRDSKAD